MTRFDSSLLTISPTHARREVLEDNFGGEYPNGHMGQTGVRAPVRAMKRFTNAYMLVYVRDVMADEILKPFAEDDTPRYLRDRLEEERLQLEARKREREEQHLYLTTKIITEDTFKVHQGFDLATFEERNLPASELPSFRVLKNEPYLTFKNRLAQEYNLSPQAFRLWVLVNRQNKTVRPDTVVPENDPNLTLEMVRDRMASRQNDLRLFLEILTPESRPPASDPQQPPLMIFLKYFDVSRQSLTGIGRVYVNRNQKVSDLVPTINEMQRWAPQTQIKLYEEIKPGMIEQMKAKATFAQSEIQDGDVICFQVDISDKDAQDYEMQSLYSNPIQFYDFLQNQIKVLFKPRSEDAEYKQEFEMTLSKKMTYDTMANKVGDRLKHPPLMLRFTTGNGPNGTPKTVLKRTANQTVSEIVSPSYLQGQASLLYYELLDISIVELETKRSLRIYWTGAHNKEETVHSFLLPKTSSVHDLCDQLAKVVTLTAEGSKKIRIFEVPHVSGYRQQRDFNGTDMIGNIPESIDLFAEEVPVEELQLTEEERLVNVFHFSKDVSRPHGVPFRLVIKPGEPFSETKKRLQQRLDVPDKEFAKFRFALCQSSTFKQPAYLEDDDVLFEHKWQHDDAIGVDRIDKTGRGVGNRIGAPAVDRGIKIRS